MISSFMVDDIDVLRAGTATRDARGNSRPGPDTATAVSGCAVLPPAGQTAPTTELTDGRQTVTVVRVLYAPLDTDLRPTDRVRHQGRVYEVVGEPSPFVALLPHIEANLKAVTG